MPRSRPSTLALLLALVLASCSRSEPVPAESPPPVARRKDPEAARAAIARGAVVLDVRTAEEYAGDHLPNAVNVPVQELAARMAEVDALVAGDRTRPVVVYCGTGARSAKARQALEAVGYARVINGGGLDDLQ